GKLAEHIVLMDHGQIIQQGTLGDLLLRPANDRVRAFLGRQGQSLVLELLRLVHVVPELPEVPARTNPVRLPGGVRLSQALATLVEADERATVVLEGKETRAVSALQLRERILAAVHSAANT